MEIFIENYSLKFSKSGVLGAILFINKWLDGNRDEQPTLT